jgi:RNA polymerase sigma-70 factor (ECF subfamily)
LARLAPRDEGTADFTDDLAGRLDDEHVMRGVLGMIGRLPVPDQDVLSLCLWQGLSYADAAVALDVPVGTVRSRLSRARHRLRELVIDTGHVEVDTAQAQGEPRRRARDG